RRACTCRGSHPLGPPAPVGPNQTDFFGASGLAGDPVVTSRALNDPRARVAASSPRGLPPMPQALDELAPLEVLRPGAVAGVPLSLPIDHIDEDPLQPRSEFDPIRCPARSTRCRHRSHLLKHELRFPGTPERRGTTGHLERGLADAWGSRFEDCWRR